MKLDMRGKRFPTARTLLFRVVLTVVGAAAVGGCSRKVETIVIRGSNTVGEELAPRLIVEYRKEHPEAAFNIEFKGTTYGLGALMVDGCDIAAASREVTTNELALAQDRDITFNDHVIGAYSVAVIVNAACPVNNLTTNQARDIFTGAVSNWKEVGGPDGPIHLYIRDPISGTYLGFRELVMENKPYALHVKTFTNYLQIARAVAQDPLGIGYASVELSAQPGIRPVAIDGVAPTPAVVKKGGYPYVRLLRLYTSKGKESAAATAFIQFVQSERGQKILDEMGYVPRP